MIEKKIENKDYLERKAFPDRIDKVIFLERLKLNDNIEGIFISREEFSNKKGSFLDEVGNNEYKLYLPIDIKYSELPSIIYRVNKITFGKELPEYASANEMKVKIVMLIDSLLNQIGDNRNPDIQNIIKKYVRLYEQLSSVQETQKISNPDYRKKIIEESSGDEDNTRFSKLLIGINTKEKLESFNDELIKHTRESFFERGISELRGNGMPTYTKNNFSELEKKVDNGEISKEKVFFKEIFDELDDAERPLREKINIDKFKIELDELRKNGNKEQIEQKELEATNAILKSIYEYPRQLTNNYGYSPSKIKVYKEIYCTGFSLLGHSFLQELGITHKGLVIPEHSALDIRIGLKKYYFDGTCSPEIIEFNFMDIDNYKGVYKKIKLVGFEFVADTIGYSGPVEEMLQSQMLSTIGKDHEESGKYEESIICHNKALKMISYDFDTWGNLSIPYLKLGKIDIANLLGYIYNKIGNKHYWRGYIFSGIGNKTQKKTINSFIDNKDFDGLRDYVFSLEKF